MVNGLVFAAVVVGAAGGQLENPLEVTEKSETYHGGVWTGTRPDGTAVPWDRALRRLVERFFLKAGHYGYSDRTTPEWTLSA
jgi:hypothetical protein